MHNRMVITLSDQERKALRTAAKQQLRGMNDQARYMVRQELKRQGLLDVCQPDGDRASTGGR